MTRTHRHRVSGISGYDYPGGFKMTVHHFQPTTYYISFGSHPPALHIASGDTVETVPLK
jgi:hypothetical protein